MAGAFTQAGVEMVVKGLQKFQRGLQKADKSTGKFGKSIEKMGKVGKVGSKLMDGLTGVVTGLGVAGGVAAGGLMALDKALDFGAEGATIQQTRASFDGLMDSMGVAPDILDDMRNATRGTVDDMTLMSSTMTLLAGTSEDLGRAMVSNAPKLLEIAKAANKLNPSLGDTAFLYNSLATGIKRSSPLILDNLGLVVKIGEANAAWAKKMGTTVEAMSAQDKQMALLEAALTAGDRMIEQVGGSTDAMGDSFAQAEARLKNVTDELKTKLVPATAAAAEELSRFLIVASGQLPEELVKTIDATEDAGKSFAQLAEEAREAKAMIIYGGTEQEEAKLFWIDMSKTVKLTAEEFVKLGLAVGATWPEIVKLAETMDIELDRSDWADYAAEVLNAASAVEPWIEREREAAEAARLTADELEALRGSMVGVGAAFGPLAFDAQVLADVFKNQAAIAADDFKASLDTLHLAMKGEYGEVLAEYRNEINQATAAYEAGEKTVAEYTDFVRQSTEAFIENTNAIIFNIAEKQILDALEKDLIEDVNASGTAYDEATEALWAMAYQMGLVDEATLELMEATQGQTQAFIDGKVTADELAGGLGGLAGEAAGAASQGRDLGGVIAALESKTITITTNYVTTGYPGQYEAGTGPQYQHGAQFTVGGPTGVDRTPVYFMATRGEVVTVTPAGRAAVGAGINLNFGEVNINSNMDEAAFYANVEMAVSRAIQGV